MKWRGYVVDSEEFFRKFRFLYTGVVVRGVPSFSMAKFEIHGPVRPDTTEPSFEAPYDKVSEQFEEFNPWSIAEF
jgi:hypothetical protein